MKPNFSSCIVIKFRTNLKSARNVWYLVIDTFASCYWWCSSYCLFERHRGVQWNITFSLKYCDCADHNCLLSHGLMDLGRMALYLATPCNGTHSQDGRRVGCPKCIWHWTVEREWGCLWKAWWSWWANHERWCTSVATIYHRSGRFFERDTEIRTVTLSHCFRGLAWLNGNFILIMKVK